MNKEIPFRRRCIPERDVLNRAVGITRCGVGGFASSSHALNDSYNDKLSVKMNHAWP